MLGLERTIGTSFWIGDNIQVKVLEVRGRRVRLGITAPREITILREELLGTAPTAPGGETTGQSLQVA